MLDKAFDAALKRSRRAKNPLADRAVEPTMLEMRLSLSTTWSAGS